MKHHHEGQGVRALFRNPRHLAVLVLIGGLLAYYLLTRHWAHLRDALPWLIALACPLMHLFMHGGHGAHGGQASQPADKDAGAGDSESAR